MTHNWTREKKGYTWHSDAPKAQPISAGGLRLRSDQPMEGGTLEVRLRTGALAALTVWFVVDTGASLTFGVWGNVVAVNLPVYLAIALPLAIGGRARRATEKIR